MLALMEAWRAVRARTTPEEWLRTVTLWLFTPRTYEERPDFVELVIQTGLANPHPFSLTGFLRQGDAVRSHDALDRVPSLSCPTLVSIAADDILVRPRLSRQLAQAVPRAELRVIEDAGHGYFWERADEFNAMCLEFLERHAKA
jgi:pimeloyl-ACP methyl ester carboxylesterase